MTSAKDTTPARAEAQDEGAAGKPVAWRWRFVVRDGPLSWNFSEEPVEEHLGPHPNFQRREVQPLYAHPSPTPAACSDEEAHPRVMELTAEIDEAAGILGGEIKGRAEWALGNMILERLSTPAADADRVRVAVERGLKHFDATSAMCPFNKSPSPPKEKPCPICKAEKSEGCRREITGAFGFVSEVREALKSTAAKEGGE